MRDMKWESQTEEGERRCQELMPEQIKNQLGVGAKQRRHRDNQNIDERPLNVSHCHLPEYQVRGCKLVKGTMRNVNETPASNQPKRVQTHNSPARYHSDAMQSGL